MKFKMRHFFVSVLTAILCACGLHVGNSGSPTPDPSEKIPSVICKDETFCMPLGQVVVSDKNHTFQHPTWDPSQGAAIVDVNPDGHRFFRSANASIEVGSPNASPVSAIAGGFAWVDGGGTATLTDDRFNISGSVLLSEMTIDPEEWCRPYTRRSLASNPDRSRLALVEAGCTGGVFRLFDGNGTLLSTTTLIDSDHVVVIPPPLSIPHYDLAHDSFVVTYTLWNKSENGFDATIWAATAGDGSGRVIKHFSPSSRISPVVVVSNAGHSYVVGTKEEPLLNIPNDTDEVHGYVAELDWATGSITNEVIFDGRRESYFSDATLSSTGDLYVAADEDRHHVDTGSWDGGGDAVVLRYDPDLKLIEKKSFGTPDRRESARTIRFAADRILITGWWESVPNNHLPEEENWGKYFALALPLSNWDKTTNGSIQNSIQN